MATTSTLDRSDESDDILAIEHDNPDTNDKDITVILFCATPSNMEKNLSKSHPISEYEQEFNYIIGKLRESGLYDFVNITDVNSNKMIQHLRSNKKGIKIDSLPTFVVTINGGNPIIYPGSEVEQFIDFINSQ
jgi:hypothetical protein